jgi:cell division protein FtsW
VSPPVVRHPGEFRWETRLLGLVTLILTVVGLASGYSSGAYKPQWFAEATQQGIAALIGGVLFMIAAYIDYRLWRKLALPLLLATMVGLVAIGIVAVGWRGRAADGVIGKVFPAVKGAHRWIQVGVRVQVGEIARFTLAAWLAAYAAALGTKIRDFNTGFVPVIGVIGIVCGLVALEPSYSVATTLGIIGITVIFTAGAKVQHLVPVVLVGCLALVLVLKFDAVRKKRNETFRGSPIECVTTDQECQAMIGFGGGGIKGVGFGNGTQKLGFTPEVYSDYMLSVIGEEWGFAGVVFIVLCFVVFCWMGFRIAVTAPDTFGTYFASGLTVAVGVTAFMHAAVVTWLMPSTGLTLPFISIGRVSLILYLLSAGVLVSIGRQRGKPARTK